MTEQATSDGALLEVRNLKKYFDIRKGFLRRTVGYVKAVDDVTFSVRKGETFGLVGESGCGKTTTGRCIVRLLEATDGEVIFDDVDLGRVSLRDLDKAQMHVLRRNAQIVFQDPYSSLNPRMTVKQIVAEPLIVNRIARGRELDDTVADVLRVVGLRPEYMDRYPHAFSGGQRQRISLARALALRPKFIVADEPVSALDVSVQAQVLNLMRMLQERLNLTYLFIAHDLSVIEHISDRVGVMYVGKLVEVAEAEELFLSPLHPYTEALMSAVPRADPRRRSERIVLAGEVASPAHPPPGCYFHPRCRYAQEQCRIVTPELVEMSPGHQVSCHRAHELQLRGVE
jgi:peptide/nickel transport system ATP-binding protein